MTTRTTTFRYPVAPTRTIKFAETQHGDMESPDEVRDSRTIANFQNQVDQVKTDLLSLDNGENDGNDDKGHVVVDDASPSGWKRSGLAYSGTYEETADGFKMDVLQSDWTDRTYHGRADFRILDTPDKTIFQKNELPDWPADADEMTNRTLEYDKANKEWTLMTFPEPFSIFDEPKPQPEQTFLGRLKSLWS